MGFQDFSVSISAEASFSHAGLFVLSYTDMWAAPVASAFCTCALCRGRVLTISHVQIRRALQACLVIDVHAHMAATEIIGYLAGTWDAAKKLLTIVAACPCRAAATSDSSADVSVEMDYVSATEASVWATTKQLHLVGWCVRPLLFRWVGMSHQSWM